MGYIGNDLQVAYPNYTNIDDISGSFNGVTTSFALTVGGVAPVPAPRGSNQCMISVGGVIQRPDDTGAEGFRLSGGNIVFSSAPNTGEDFFGVILAGADYVNVGANFPSGTAAVPSITFDSDLDTGILNPAANELAFTTGGTQRLSISSAGQLSNNLGTAGAPSYTFTGDVNTGIYSPGADQVAISTNGTGRLFVDSSGRVGVGTGSPTQKLSVADAAGLMDITSTTGTNFNGLELKNTSGSLYVGTDSSTGSFYGAGNYGRAIYSTGAYPLAFFTNATRAMTIDSSQRVGIGTTSPGAHLDVRDNVGGSARLDIHSQGGGGVLSTLVAERSGGLRISSESSAGWLAFNTGSSGTSERARIDSSGRLLVGTSSGSYKFQINALGSGGFAFDDTNGVISNTFGTGGGIALRAQVGSSAGGGEVYLGGSTRGDANKNRVVCTPGSNGVYLAENATSWTASSDERKKTDLIPIDDALGKVGTLRAVTGRYLTDAEGTSRSFLIAQDVQVVLPEAVDTSDPDSLGVSYTDVIPLLVAALKESKERIEQLEAEMAEVKAQLS